MLPRSRPLPTARALLAFHAPRRHGHGRLSRRGRWPRGLRALVAGVAVRASALVSQCRRVAGRRRRVVRNAAARAAVLAEPVPVLLLGGFLGAGKTTLLKHWLESTDDRIGVIVNDVASVNVDAKLVKRQTNFSQGSSLMQTIQLQNGCACCSLGDELVTSLFDLMRLMSPGEPFTHVVIELSGVAEPARVCELLEDSALSRRAELAKVVTLVDASTFCEDYMAYQRIAERPDLWEAGAQEAGSAQLRVVELLVEQVEAADVVLLNKFDLASPQQLATSRAVVAALNKQAVVLETSYGRVPLATVMAAEPPVARETGAGVSAVEVERDRGHDLFERLTVQELRRRLRELGLPTAGRKAQLAERLAAAGVAEEGGAAKETHGHGHEHGHAHGQEHGQESARTSAQETHSHGHEHGHEHSHGNGRTTAQERFGIESFVYAARRPFHAERVAEIMQDWPVPKASRLEQVLQVGGGGGSEAESPLARVLRSKGFCWLDTHPLMMLYWSHVGRRATLSEEDMWWGAMNQNQLQFTASTNPEEYDRVLREEWTPEWGDRRQEIVFIGQAMDETAIRKVLDTCLVTDDELEQYRQRQQQEMAYNL